MILRCGSDVFMPISSSPNLSLLLREAIRVILEEDTFTFILSTIGVFIRLALTKEMSVNFYGFIILLWEWNGTEFRY